MKWSEAVAETLQVLIQAIVIVSVVFMVSQCVEKSYSQAAGPVTYEDLKPIIQARCVMCHGDNNPDKNWTKPEQLRAHKDQVMDRVVVKKNMPPIPGMTDNERNMFKLWVEGGAK